VKVYVAGPMTGIPQFNIPAFDEMAARLRDMGHEVVSPAELDSPETRAIQLASKTGSMADLPPGDTWGMFLARDVKLLADDGIEGIVVLPGWDRSRGARLETFVANALCGLPVMSYSPWWDGTLVEVTELDLFRAWTGDPTLQARRRVFA
jgi:hypothetical protein